MPLSRANRPRRIIVVVSCVGNFRVCTGCFAPVEASCAYLVTAPHVDLINGTRHAVSRSKLPLLQRSLYKNVVVLLIRESDVRNFTVENQAVPICMRLLFAVATGETVALF